MSFEQHAQMHGLMIRHAISDGRWHRVPTVDKPKKRNGAYIWDGERGVVRNWATMEGYAKYPDRQEAWKDIKLRVFDDSAEKIRQARVAKHAQEMIRQAVYDKHAYFAAKGFPDMKGLVLNDELLIPMRDFVTYEPMSIQRIKPDGEKRFLAGGKTKNTVFIINKKFMNMGVYLCEGFATGLSIQAGLEALFRNAAVVVCFSASNMIHVGKQIKRACVFADHDDTGIRAAEELGFPWMKSEAAGEDANDLHMRAGVMALRKALSESSPASPRKLRG